jgi:hypothetical protein
MHAILKYPRTRHLAGSALQKGDENDRLSMASLKDRDLLFVWEEKADGANAGLSFDPTEGAMVLQSRGHSLDGGSRERQFDMYKAWAQTFESDFRDALGTRYVLYGEWMAAKHSSAYDNLPHLLLTYDLYDRERNVFLSTKARASVLDGLPIVPVHVVHEGWVADRDVPKLVRSSVYKTPNWRESLKLAAIAAGVDPIRALAETDDSDLAEGVYLKVENERGETVERGKFVRAAFIQHIIDSGSHWASRPIIENHLAPGVDLFAHPGGCAKAAP